MNWGKNYATKGLFWGTYMIEIYLFVNPLGMECYQAEKQILQLVDAEKSKKIQFRFVPFINMHVVDRLIKKYHLPKNDLAWRNRLFHTLYSAALDYKALQLQGKKKGRFFLLQLQKSCGLEKQKYSPALVESLVVKAGGDLEEFRLDRASNFVKEAFLTDQQIAHDMSIEDTPSCVVYNYSCQRDFGVLLEGDWCKDPVALKELCQTDNLNGSVNKSFSLHHELYEKHPLHLV